MTAIEPFAAVDVSELAAWLRTVPLADWPKMADPDSLGAGNRIRAIADRLMIEFPGCSLSGVGLFLLAPGQHHPPHEDIQPPNWVTRVHVPVVTNRHAIAITPDGAIHMEAGVAYTFDTRATHAVRNDGSEPRVHMVFDVVRKP